MSINPFCGDFNIVVTEYPKSGGTWLTTLIGTSLGIPKRDLYVTEESIKTPLYQGMLNHHWYNEDQSVDLNVPCVVKSHELPNSPLIYFNAKYLHLLRDGRDVVVSRYFFEKDFYVKNQLAKKFDMSFEDFLVKVAHEWKSYVTVWLNEKIPYVKYEDLLTDTKKTLIDIFNKFELNYNHAAVDFAINDNTKDKSSEKLKHIYKYNTFVRKGIQGDWKNHFTKKHSKIFNQIAGDLLTELLYEKETTTKVYLKKAKQTLLSLLK